MLRTVTFLFNFHPNFAPGIIHPSIFIESLLGDRHCAGPGHYLRAFLWTQFSKGHKNFKDKFDSHMRVVNGMLV